MCMCVVCNTMYICVIESLKAKLVRLKGSYDHQTDRSVGFNRSIKPGTLLNSQVSNFVLKNKLDEKKKKRKYCLPQGHPQGASGQIIKAFRPPMLRIRALVAHVYCTSNDDKRQQNSFLFLNKPFVWGTVP